MKKEGYTQEGMKTCNRCKKSKNLDSFWKDSSRVDGRYPTCKVCKKGSWNNYKNTNAAKEKERRRRIKHRDKIRATRYLQQAVRSGKIKKEPCLICGDKKVDGHHLLYEYKDKVVWLCRQHHKDAHFQATIN